MGRKRLGALGTVALMALSLAGAAKAQETCGGVYTVKAGDSLSGIADRLYQNAGMWSSIHTNNIDAIGQSPNNIRVGMQLNLGCINGLPNGLPGGRAVTEARASAPVQIAPGNAATRQKINVLTGSDFAPFTDKDLPGGGILTEVVQAAMEAAAPKQGFAIHWVNDWAAHHEPLLSNALLDIGFPWYKPDCEADPTTYRCANLMFSDSMFEVLMLLFVDAERPFAYNSSEDMRGKVLCRPAGYSTYIFDQQRRNWLRDGVISLETPGTPGDCMRMLTEGKVDGVVLNEFLGREKIKELGLQGKVLVASGQPISVDGNHMVVHKSHPHGREFLAVFEEGLAKIKADGSYQSIVDAHMTRIWAEF
ncbi:transporter substrate-binding domain-containing protein [Primorskyibacter aestuariivivens]|uniref:LysM peptidoglycan-binding domain-containing protein n=1 Tax=Primorskyibacter aestuariivivens TaxID=1888912 RepID=UPI002301478D|nr:transporter substrate-binding domain-containing protein [Primorskyibacter aestuariivivens]MDA7427177.1 transporter substrate-binding domain-containing protein [Primorskyibacter aestuariivivens]